MQSIVSVQSYRSAAHIAFKSIDYRRGAFPTDSTCPDHPREQAPAYGRRLVDRVVRQHYFSCCPGSLPVAKNSSSSSVKGSCATIQRAR